MADLITFFIWSLLVFSATNLVVVSKIFYKFRLWVTYKNLKLITDEKGTRYEGSMRKFQFISGLVHCHMCLGFWVGILASMFVYSPATYILMGDFEYGNLFCDGLLGSITSWLFYLFINDRQSKT